MKIKDSIKFSDFEVGVLICRFQASALHDGHKELLDFVTTNHKKVIIFLGVSKNVSKKNPLDFATREAMIKEGYPNVQVIPLEDQRYNTTWSKILDGKCKEPFGEKTMLLYGSRDSFIPAYSGNYSTVELEGSFDLNATAKREEVARGLVTTEQGREGIIYSVYGRRPSIFPTVDVVVANDKGQILLAKKPHETLYRFVGGFVDATDSSYEAAAKRELAEETGGNLMVNDWRFVTSTQVDDWRMRGIEHSIMTSLFIAQYGGGLATASDDIAHVEWIDANKFSNFDGVRTLIVPEHRGLMTELMKQAYDVHNIRMIKNLGEKFPELEGITYTGE